MALWEESKWGFKVGIVGGIGWGRPKADGNGDDGAGAGDGDGTKKKAEIENGGGGGGGGGGGVKDERHFDFLAPHCENVRRSSQFYSRMPKFVLLTCCENEKAINQMFIIKRFKF